jgi:UDPglucose--hexose-1-phosphate uridylyltransferase
MEHQSFNSNEHSHTRLNILTGESVLVSPHRAKRPWQGKIESDFLDDRNVYEPKCYLCPNNERVSGKINPDYKETFVFINDFAALENNVSQGEFNIDNLLIAKSEIGICKVICFSEKHNLTIPEMDLNHLKKVVDTWQSEFNQLSKEKNIKHIQIFENKGEIMGCSNPHPHGQIWAQSSIPVEINKEINNQEKYFEIHGKSLLSDYLTLELNKKERIVYENDNFVVLVPFWAIWPYETMIISKKHIKNISILDDKEKLDLADCIKILTIKYDNLFKTSFPYSAGLHQSPIDKEYKGWHFHIHFYPPLLRSSTVKKFMVGYELLCNPQRDITPEYSAEVLRNLSTIHYKNIQ